MSEDDDHQVLIKRLVLDVYKLKNPPIYELAVILAENVPNIKRVIFERVETDENTEVVKLTVEGPDLDLYDIMDELKKYGATVRSVDLVEAVVVRIFSEKSR